MVNAHWGLYPTPFPLPFAGSARLHALFAYGGHEACQIVVNYFYYNFPFVFALCDFFTVTPSAHTLRPSPTLYLQSIPIYIAYIVYIICCIYKYYIYT